MKRECFRDVAFGAKNIANVAAVVLFFAAVFVPTLENTNILSYRLWPYTRTWGNGPAHNDIFGYFVAANSFFGINSAIPRGVRQ